MLAILTASLQQEFGWASALEVIADDREWLAGDRARCGHPRHHRAFYAGRVEALQCRLAGKHQIGEARTVRRQAKPRRAKGRSDSALGRVDVCPPVLRV